MTYASSLFFNKQNKLETSLLLPLRDVVLLPGITLPVVAGKPRSVAVVESAMLTENKQLIVTAIRPQALQRFKELATAQVAHDSSTTKKPTFPEIESFQEIYPVATLAVIHKMSRLPGGPIQLIIEGLERVEIIALVETDPTYTVQFKRLPPVNEEESLAKGADQTTIAALTQAIKSLWTEVAAINPRFPEELLGVLLNSQEPAQLAYQTSVLLQQDVTTTQKILEEENLEKLLRQILADLQKEIEVQKLQGEILGETKKEIDQQQKEFFFTPATQKNSGTIRGNRPRASRNR